jgi:hypothetical protein
VDEERLSGGERFGLLLLAPVLAVGALLGFGLSITVGNECHGTCPGWPLYELTAALAVAGFLGFAGALVVLVVAIFQASRRLAWSAGRLAIGATLLLLAYVVVRYSFW